MVTEAMFDSNVQVSNGLSAINVVQNAPNDFSVKVVSGDGTKNVTFARYVGPSAGMNADHVRLALLEFSWLVGVEVSR